MFFYSEFLSITNIFPETRFLLKVHFRRVRFCFGIYFYKEMSYDVTVFPSTNGLCNRNTVARLRQVCSYTSSRRPEFCALMRAKKTINEQLRVMVSSTRVSRKQRGAVREIRFTKLFITSECIVLSSLIWACFDRLTVRYNPI